MQDFCGGTSLGFGRTGAISIAESQFQAKYPHRICAGIHHLVLVCRAGHRSGSAETGLSGGAGFLRGYFARFWLVPHLPPGLQN